MHGKFEHGHRAPSRSERDRAHSGELVIAYGHCKVLLELPHEPLQVPRLEVLTGVGGRRRWSSDDKARIVEESLAPGATVSEVAGRHGIRSQRCSAGGVGCGSWSQPPSG